jgi:hypothetical protein
MATNNQLALVDSYQYDSNVGGIGFSNPLGVSIPATVPQNSVRSFDISESALRLAESRGNKRSDILSAYESYLTNTPVGRGGQYAQDVVKKYGAADIRAGAASYLQAAGLTYLADIISPTPTPIDPGPIVDDTKFPLPTLNPNPVDTTPKNPFELLLDALPNLFGNQVYNPPLQSQSYGYTPEQTFDSGGNGLPIMPILLLVGLAALGYFLYKRYA